MAGLLGWLDALLRGKPLTPAAFASAGQLLPIGRLVLLSVLLGAVYGAAAGLYAATSREQVVFTQVAFAAVKVPLLFLLTLAVTFPSLYVFAALAGCRLGFLDVLRLLLSTIVVNCAVAASLAPILAFFTFSTKSYPFMIVLNVALLAVAGCVALGFLLRILRSLDVSSTPEATPPTAPPSGQPAGQPGASPQVEPSGLSVFYVWVLIYGLVGVQMGWLLRPFIGDPARDITFFRPRTGNFFGALFDHLRILLGN